MSAFCHYDLFMSVTSVTLLCDWTWPSIDLNDDVAMLRPELKGSTEPEHETNLTPQSRPNALFEAGMAMAG